MTNSRKRSSLDELRDLVARLRSPGGCPWDRAQTHRSLTPYLLEEAHEVAEAATSDDPKRLVAELGDLLMHVFLYARLAEEQGWFDVEDVARGAVEKLIRRHTHVFGDASADTPDDVRECWERAKQQEPGSSGTLAVPARLPALIRARRVQERAAAVGFDWARVEGVIDKIREELAEVEGAVGEGDQEEIAAEVGDLLFAVVNLSRFAELDPEQSLHSAVARFTARFTAMEKRLERMGKPMGSASMALMDSVWDSVKGDGGGSAV
jgi:MazG family protein